ncbi:hypothetical protein JVT61DRAFT_3810 [Boletus reticuloceps]|uniref:Translation initiation factor IF-3 n=1 Tax=Boletus reticuloceps TaxID=495285 RepID=A0A8I3A7X2_9AGAM|nr:hypothetical protein JVT61DRAFT_3810 [Boletus reticuloceps]
MASLSTYTRHHLCAFTRVWAAYRSTSVPQIPHSRSITGRPYAHVRPSYPPPPPARRHLTPAPPTSTSANASANRKQANTHPGRARRPTNRQIPFTHIHVRRHWHYWYAHERGHRHEHGTHTHTHTPTRGRDRPIIELVTSIPHPIVRITTRTEIEARYKDVKRALKEKKSAKVESKEVQLTWGVAPADVAHKMRKARRDLEKGYRVVVAVAMRHGHRPSSRRELVAFADEIADALVGVGQECKEREMTDRLMVLSFRKVEVNEDAR